jgi:hypothetical protein
MQCSRLASKDVAVVFFSFSQKETKKEYNRILPRESARSIEFLRNNVNETFKI